MTLAYAILKLFITMSCLSFLSLCFVVIRSQRTQPPDESSAAGAARQPAPDTQYHLRPPPLIVYDTQSTYLAQRGSATVRTRGQNVKKLTSTCLLNSF